MNIRVTATSNIKMAQDILGKEGTEKVFSAFHFLQDYINKYKEEINTLKKGYKKIGSLATCEDSTGNSIYNIHIHEDIKCIEFCYGNWLNNKLELTCKLYVSSDTGAFLNPLINVVVGTGTSQVVIEYLDMDFFTL